MLTGTLNMKRRLLQCINDGTDCRYQMLKFQALWTTILLTGTLNMKRRLLCIDDWTDCRYQMFEIQALWGGGAHGARVQPGGGDQADYR